MDDRDEHDAERDEAADAEHDAERDAERVGSRAELQAEEQEAGVSDPTALAEAVLDESEERMARRPDAQGVEHRQSEDTVDPIEAD